MEQADNPGAPSGQSSVELLIVGAGVMGLWAALKADRLGIRTLLIDAGQAGRGASAGLVGALMAHMPDKWNGKKQFQFDSLVQLEAEVARLEAETGLSCGYRRTGRLIPLPKPHLAEIARRHGADARAHWIAGERQFAWNLLDRSPDAGWLDGSVGACGVVFDTLAAHVAPRQYGTALVAAVRQARNVRLVEGNPVVRLDGSRAVLADGMNITFGHAIVANGHQAFPLLESLGPSLAKPLGMPVKGQSALLAADVDPAMPVIFMNGLYVVAHEGGRVAVGSTSEDVFADPFSTDTQLDVLIERARQISPAIADAPVIERWAGLRPKAIDRDPMVGPHPDHSRILALAGGFKVSFGIAHQLADRVMDAVCGRPMAMPESFFLENHLTVARG